MTTVERTIGAAVDRIEGHAKVTGEALYAVEYPIENAAHAVAVQSTVARGTIRSVDTAAALAVDGVLAVISHETAPALERVDNGELHLFQSPQISYRGQYVAAVVAETLEAAQEAAHLVRLEVDEEPHDVLLSAERDDLYAPSSVNGGYATDSAVGDFDAAFADAAVQFDRTYSTPAEHNNPIEPHASLAVWDGEGLTLYDANQSAHFTRDLVAKIFGLDPERVHVIARHVGGGFGAKGLPHPPTILAVMAAKVVGRPVRFATTRQQMFAVTGYRTPTISRIRLGADKDGRLVAIGHDAISQSSRINEFTEQTATPTRMMYAAANRLTTHRLARLDVPTPSWLRAPGETPGMFALESAMDELAVQLGLDPVELRILNEPPIDPEEQVDWSSRHLVECLREGAERFGWNPHTARREGRWLIGTGVAASTYPARLPPSQATIRVEADGRYTVLIDATDIGTGARTALTQIAADSLEEPIERITVEIGDSSLPRAMLAGGSMGMASWGTAVLLAARKLRDEGGNEATVDTTSFVRTRPKLSYHAFGAQFVEARVDVDTGEVRVPRALGVFAAGRIVNAKTARSQLIGGMTMGISMALHEESVMDVEYGDYVNRDLADYHVAVNADIVELDAVWVEEHDEHVNPLGTKGIGEIGITGTAAAVANAVHHATGVRIRDLPIRLDKLLGRLGRE